MRNHVGGLIEVKPELAPEHTFDLHVRVAGLLKVRHGRNLEQVGFRVRVQNHTAAAHRGKLLVQLSAGVHHVSNGAERGLTGGADEAIHIHILIVDVGVHRVGQGADGLGDVHGEEGLALHDLHTLLVSDEEGDFLPLVKGDLHEPRRAVLSRSVGHGRGDVGGGEGVAHRNVDGGATHRAFGGVIKVDKTRHHSLLTQRQKATGEKPGNKIGQTIGHQSLLC